MSRVTPHFNGFVFLTPHPFPIRRKRMIMSLYQMLTNGLRMAPESAPSAPLNAQLTPEQMRLGIRSLEACIAEVEAFDPSAILARPEDISAKAAAIKATIESTLDETFGHGTVEYERYSPAASFDVPFSIDYEYSRDVTIEGLRNARTRSLALLRQAMTLLNRN
jgi:hypothetical protein